MDRRLTARTESGRAYYKECFEEPCFGNGCITDDCEEMQKQCEKLAQYEDLEESGKMLKAPCVIGDTAYSVIDDEVVGKSHISEWKVGGIMWDGVTWYLYDAADMQIVDNVGSQYCLLTREEAEEKLKELEGKA